MSRPALRSTQSLFPWLPGAIVSILHTAPGTHWLHCPVCSEIHPDQPFFLWRVQATSDTHQSLTPLGYILTQSPTLGFFSTAYRPATRLIRLLSQWIFSPVPKVALGPIQSLMHWAPGVIPQCPVRLWDPPNPSCPRYRGHFSEVSRLALGL
jgi:hypothetical protein